MEVKTSLMFLFSFFTSRKLQFVHIPMRLLTTAINVLRDKKVNLPGVKVTSGHLSLVEMKLKHQMFWTLRPHPHERQKTCIFWKIAHFLKNCTFFKNMCTFFKNMCTFFKNMCTFFKIKMHAFSLVWMRP